MTKTSVSSRAELHLCNNQRHLFFALADALGRDAVAVVVYLEDHVSLGTDLKSRLRNLGPQITIQFTTDAAEMENFIRLPWPVPQVFRRNWRPDGIRVQDWQLQVLGGQRFSTGYLYHTGFFAAKSAVASCDRLVMREAGLNNYVTHPVSGLKVVLRALSGLPPRMQIWGEESWVDAIEVSEPDRLPDAVRSKAIRMGFTDIYERLSRDQTKQLAEILLPVPPALRAQGGRRALLLTQPLDMIGLATQAEKASVYSKLAAHMIAQGYRVYVKHHPVDRPFAVNGAEQLEAQFPIELWPALHLPRFDLAVALCSASLVEGKALIADRIVQLMTPEEFDAEGCADFLARWPKDVTRLAL